MSAVKINLVCIIISVFAGYHLQTIYEINNSIYWKYSLACLIIRTDSPAIINSNYLTPILVFIHYRIHGLISLYQEADSCHYTMPACTVPKLLSSVLRIPRVSRNPLRTALSQNFLLYR